ncbi:MAG: hypothetical protein MI749_02895 [Desulfovibrionales bacterium]|nr:hypothetical protein [Desulfovibrionales bacterium]
MDSQRTVVKTAKQHVEDVFAYSDRLNEMTTPELLKEVNDLPGYPTHDRMLVVALANRLRRVVEAQNLFKQQAA